MSYTTWELIMLMESKGHIPSLDTKVKGHQRFQFLLFDSARFKSKFGVFGQKIKKWGLLKNGDPHVKNRNVHFSNGRNC